MIWPGMDGSGLIGGMMILVRAVCFVAGAGTSTPGAVGRLIATSSTPSAGATSLASAWSSSRSQLAAHSGFVFERESSTNILVRGVEGRNASRQNVLVTNDNRNDHLRWSKFFLKIPVIRYFFYIFFTLHKISCIIGVKP